MKKTLLAGIVLIVLIILIITSGRIAEFSWGGDLPGAVPSQLWVRPVNGSLKVVERAGKVTLLEVLEDSSTSITGIDYYGREVWVDTWESPQDINFQSHHWGHTDLSEGMISVFDYNGKLVRRARAAAEYKHYWLGPRGELLFSRSVSPEVSRLEGLYGEKGVVFNAQGEQVFEETFAGMGILDMKLLPETETLVVSLVEIFPYLSTRVVFTNFKGHKLAEAREEKLFLPPIILEENRVVALVSGSSLYLYSFEGVPLFKTEWNDPVTDAFSGPGESLMLVSSPHQALKEKTLLYCLDIKGNRIWEKELPGGYRQGKTRNDGGIIIETELYIYLLHSDGSIQGYYSPQEGQQIFLFSTDLFLSYGSGILAAYSWPMKE